MEGSNQVNMHKENELKIRDSNTMATWSNQLTVEQMWGRHFHLNQLHSAIHFHRERPHNQKWDLIATIPNIMIYIVHRFHDISSKR